MPLCTYLHDPPEGPPESSDEAARLWEDFQAATGKDYCVRERKIRTERWLSDDLVEHRYDLMSHVHGPEWQIHQCVSREADLLAYMYGAINAAANAHQSDAFGQPSHA